MGWDLILIYLPPSSHRNCNERAKVDAASSRTLFLLEHPSQATRLNGGCYWTLLPDGWSTPIQSKTFQFFFSIFLFFYQLFCRARNDWVLKIIYRTSAAAYDVAGLQAIDIEHNRLVNINLSELINGWWME